MTLTVRQVPTEGPDFDRYIAICANLYERNGQGNPDDVAAKVRAEGGVADAQVVGDTEGAVKWMRAQPGHNGKVGVFGSCSGGRHAFLYACHKKDVDACVDRPPRLGRVADGQRGDGPCVVDGRHMRSRIAPEERHEPDAAVERGRESLVLRPLENEVHAKWSVGQRVRLGEQSRDVLDRDPGEREHSETPGVGDRCGQLGTSYSSESGECYGMADIEHSREASRDHLLLLKMP